MQAMRVSAACVHRCRGHKDRIGRSASGRIDRGPRAASGRIVIDDGFGPDAFCGPRPVQRSCGFGPDHFEGGPGRIACTERPRIADQAAAYFNLESNEDGIALTFESSRRLRAGSHQTVRLRAGDGYSSQGLWVKQTLTSSRPVCTLSLNLFGKIHGLQVYQCPDAGGTSIPMGVAVKAEPNTIYFSADEPGSMLQL